MEAIKQVTQTEQLSQDRKDAALVESRKQLASAQRDAQNLLEDSRQRAQAQIRELMTQAEQRAAQRQQGVLTQAQTECAKMKEKAQTRLEAAAKFIAERVVKV